MICAVRVVLPSAVLLVGIALPGPGLVTAQEPQAPPPVFRDVTELIAIDASVVDDKGAPVPDLRAAHFSVTVDGRPRRVVNAEFIRQEPLPMGERPDPHPAFSTNEADVGGRLVLLVFDQESLGPSTARAVAGGAADFLDQLSPVDRVGVFAFPAGQNVNFTANREIVRAALTKIAGRAITTPVSPYALGLSEAFQIDEGDAFAIQQAELRECVHEQSEEGRALCSQVLRSEARQMVVVAQQRTFESLRVLRRLLAELQKYDAPKTVIWASEGLPLETARADIGGLAAAAGAARTTLHVLHLDQSHIVDVTRNSPTPTLMADRRLQLEGLEAIAGVSRGAVFSSVAPGHTGFSRIAREMTGYYLLSVEPEPADRDGRSHELTVSVQRPNTKVRARRTFALVPPPETLPPIEAQVADLLRSPLIATDVPLRVATHNLREPGDPNIRVVVSSELGRSANAPMRAAVGYLVTTREGKVVATAYQDRTLSPQEPGEPGPLQAVGMVAVPPGSYILRLGVIDEDGRKGSVDHGFEAALATSAGVELGDLLLFPASSDPRQMHVTTDTTLRPIPHNVHWELYPPEEGWLKKPQVVVEVADHPDAPALARAEATIVEDKGARVVVRGPLPLTLLPPGDYFVRAIVFDEAITARQLRRFSVQRTIIGDSALQPELNATVAAFAPDQVLVPEVLQPALARARELDAGSASEETTTAADALASGDLLVLDDPRRFKPANSLMASFLRGLGLFREGRLEDAAGQFRESVRLSSEFLPGLFYLGACYAAGGRDREAVGAWQTSLIGDASIAEVFRLIADGYLRLGDAEGATSALEEAQATWPDDESWARRIVQAGAIGGDPQRALRVLLAWIEREPGDQAMVDLALRLAMTDLAQRGAADPEAAERLRAAVRSVERSGRRPPALAERWLAYVGAGSTSP